MEAPSKSCRLDPIPSWLLKSCLDELLPIITKIINLSFQKGRFPDALKIAHISPLIKKQSLDRENPQNYRPIANLEYLAKTIERAVAAEIQSYLARNDLFGNMQSAYRKNRSVKTALNDLLLAVDQGQEAVLILLDYSAAFDTIDHHIMLQRLRQRYGITCSALDWFASYFSNRQQSIVIGNATSIPYKVNIGVPQGSVLGPLCFTL